MNRIYLVVVDLYESEENAIVNICSNRETAEKLIKEYQNNCDDVLDYHIDEVELDPNKDILWDCYDNNEYRIR